MYLFILGDNFPNATIIVVNAAFIAAVIFAKSKFLVEKCQFCRSCIFCQKMEEL